MTATQRPLATHELHYIFDVRRALTGVTRATRRELVATLTENLLDRPPTANHDALEAALGTPVEYADQLLDEADTATPGSIARSRRRHRINLAAITAVVLVVVTSGVLTYRWWSDWQAEMGQSSWRICADDGADPTTCDQSLFTDASNTVRSATTVRCVPGRIFTLSVGLWTSRPVEVTGIEIAGADLADSSLLRLDAVAVHQRMPPDTMFSPTPVSLPVIVGDASAPFGGDYEFRLHYTLVCARAHWSPNSTVTFEDLRVHYQALGKNRVQDVPLMYALQVYAARHP